MSDLQSQDINPLAYSNILATIISKFEAPNPELIVSQCCSLARVIDVINAEDELDKLNKERLVVISETSDIGLIDEGLKKRFDYFHKIVDKQLMDLNENTECEVMTANIENSIGRSARTLGPKLLQNAFFVCSNR